MPSLIAMGYYILYSMGTPLSMAQNYKIFRQHEEAQL
jgi:hypothetical protein